jgi:hypothetical protein
MAFPAYLVGDDAYEDVTSGREVPLDSPEYSLVRVPLAVA